MRPKANTGFRANNFGCYDYISHFVHFLQHINYHYDFWYMGFNYINHRVTEGLLICTSVHFVHNHYFFR